MLAALIVVFREVIEAGLIVGIVLATLRGVPGRFRLVGIGIAAGLAGAGVLAAVMGRLASLFDGSGQEIFSATVLLTAVAMLTWHNVWMASHGRAMAQELRAMGRDILSGQRAPAAVAVVVGLALLREGAEVALFLYGILAAGGTDAVGVATGGGLGVLSGIAVAALMYAGLLAIPARRLFSATSGLITLLAAGLAAQAVAYLQQGGFALVWQEPLWDTSMILSEDSIIGHVAHVLLGYVEQPNGLQAVAWVGTVAGITLLARWVQRTPVPPLRAATA